MDIAGVKRVESVLIAILVVDSTAGVNLFCTFLLKAVIVGGSLPMLRLLIVFCMGNRKQEKGYDGAFHLSYCIEFNINNLL